MLLLTALLVQRLSVQNCRRAGYVCVFQEKRKCIAHISLGEDNIVIPSSLLPELRKLPDDVLSFPAAVKQVCRREQLMSKQS